MVKPLHTSWPLYTDLVIAEQHKASLISRQRILTATHEGLTLIVRPSSSRHMFRAPGLRWQSCDQNLHHRKRREERLVGCNDARIGSATITNAPRGLNLFHK